MGESSKSILKKLLVKHYGKHGVTLNDVNKYIGISKQLKVASNFPFILRRFSLTLKRLTSSKTFMGSNLE